MTEYYINITKEEIEGYDAITVSVTDEDSMTIVSSTEFQRLSDILNLMDEDMDRFIMNNIQQVIDDLTTGTYVLNYSTNSTNLINDDETLTFEMVKDAVGLFDMLKEINDDFELISIGREARISLTATNPYLLSNGTTDVVVKLKDDLGEPLINKKVAIEQSVFRDGGTTVSHNDDWVKYNPNNVTITRGGEYTSVTGSNYRYGVPISNNCKIRVETRKPAQSTGTLLSLWTYDSSPLFASQLLLFSVTEMGMTQGTFANLEMTVTPTTVTVKNLDNDTTITKEYSTTHNLIFNFWGTVFDYKNFKVYETINGVTDENGEFALHDVNVTDDTTFTATYGTETATCLVEYCDFVDYAVTNNKNNTWLNNTGGSITVDDSGTTFTAVPHSNGTHWTCGYCPASTTSRSPFSYPIIVEFDILQWDTGASIWIKSDLGNRTSFNRELNHIGSRARIEIGTTSTKIYIDGSFVSEKTYTQPSSYGIEFGAYINKSDSPTAPSLKFANLTIRPL